MKYLTVGFLIAMASICMTRAQTPVTTPAGAPRVVGGERRENDPKFSAAERALIATARRILEARDKRPVDAYYGIRKTNEGYEVQVTYVSWDGNKPIFVPGNFCVVALD